MPRTKKDPEEVLTTMGVSVLPSTDAEVQAIADGEERTKSWTAGRLLLRGLVAYRKDGKLTVEDAPKPVRRAASSKSLKPSRAAIRKGLDNARGFHGEPVSKKDRETIQKEIEKDAEQTEEE